MQGQRLLKLLSKIPRNGSTNFLSPKSVLKTHSNPFHQHHFSEISTLSRSHLWKICNPNGVSGKIRNGVLWSNTGRSKFPVGVHTRRNFHSFDSHNRGWRSVSRRLTTDGVVLGLIITNVAVFMVWSIAGHEFMVKNFMISVDNFTSGRLHTLITNAFSHKDMSHLVGNMIGLYFFGTSIGHTFGPQYLLKLYLSGAVVGSIFYLVYHAFIASSVQGNRMFGIDPSKVPALGASGAVNAIMLLDIFLNPTKTILFNLFIPVPAFLVGIFIIGQDVWRSLQGGGQVSGSTHLGGATVAALAFIQSKRGRFRRF
ncbi:hypothetical protein ACS0TY_030543 [Phlomoides rotata]